MKVLFFSRSNPFGHGRVGGAETSMRVMAKELASQDCNVFYIAVNKKNRSKSYSIEQHNGVEVVTINKHNFSMRLHRWLVRLFSIEKDYYKWTLGKLVKKYKPDLVYTYYLPQECSYLVNLKKKLEFKFVLRIAGQLWFEQIKRDPSLKPVYANIFSKLDAVNLLTPGNVHIFLKQLGIVDMEGIIKGEMFVEDIGISVDPLGKNRWSYQDSKPFRIVMATRFADYAKRQDILVDAIEMIPDDYEIELLLIGFGVRSEYYKELIHAKKLEHRIKIMPFMSQSELWELIYSSHLLCHACDNEGLSKIILESMAIGTPVLASDIVPLNEYLKDKDNGFLANNEPSEWANKIMKLYDDPEEMKQVSLTAQQFVLDNYDSKTRIKNYIEVFRKVIEGKSIK